jgi:hypothetical protein
MHVAPEQPPSAVEPRPDHARQPTPLSRPPEHKPGEHHHDRPAGGKLDEIRAAGTHQQFPVEPEDLFHEAVALTDAAEDRERRRIDVDASRAGLAAKEDTGRRFRRRW